VEKKNEVKSCDMEKVQDEIAFILNQSDLFAAAMNTTTASVEGKDVDIAATNVDSLVHQACDVRARLMKAMQCSGAMFDKVEIHYIATPHSLP